MVREHATCAASDFDKKESGEFRPPVKAGLNRKQKKLVLFSSSSFFQWKNPGLTRRILQGATSGLKVSAFLTQPCTGWWDSHILESLPSKSQTH